MANRTVSPSTGGSRPAMKKMYDGRAALRPIPLIVDSSERRAIAAAAADSRPKLSVVNMPMNSRPPGAGVVFGTQVSSLARISTGIYSPSVGLELTI